MSSALPAPLEAQRVPPDDGELGWLWRAQRRGAAVTPMVVVPAAVETDFYRLNNLPERLLALFEGIDLKDPDEDDLEEVAPAAQALVRDHALPGEVVEALYDALARLAAERVVVRRSGSDGDEVDRGRPALLAVKRCWVADWRWEAVAERLEGGRGLAPETVPIAIHDAAVRAAAPLDDAVRVWRDGEERLARVALRAG